MKKVTVFAPATVANVSCGFDAMGFAMDAPGDTVTVEWTEGEEVLMGDITPASMALPRQARLNTAGVAVQSFLKALGLQRGVRIALHKGLPMGSGMGSSAASAVAALVAINHLLNRPLQDLELLPHALEAERVACGSAHADNVAPCLLGGFTLVRENTPPEVVKVPLKADLWCSLVHPHFEIRTREAREALPASVPLKDAVRQAASAAGLVMGLMLPDYELIGKSLTDVIAEPFRARFIPGFYELRQKALHAGAIGCGLSGSGPTLFALCRSLQAARRVGAALTAGFANYRVNCDVHVSRVGAQGARLIR